jgi:NADPH:quinone reductase-like Zn-dependent oxidoreductase
MFAYLLNGEGTEGLALVSQLEPDAPQTGEVLVKLRAASLNHRDLLVLNGH